MGAGASKRKQHVIVVVGLSQSGKSALIHRLLSNRYMPSAYDARTVHSLPLAPGYASSSWVFCECPLPSTNSSLHSLSTLPQQPHVVLHVIDGSDDLRMQYAQLMQHELASAFEKDPKQKVFPLRIRVITKSDLSDDASIKSLALSSFAGEFTYARQFVVSAQSGAGISDLVLFLQNTFSGSATTNRHVAPQRSVSRPGSAGGSGP
jgi:50S ribosomal subunit-associated GTPase HflX